MTTYVKFPIYDVNGFALSGAAAVFSALVADDDTALAPPQITEIGNSGIYRVGFEDAQLLGGVNGIVDGGANASPRMQFLEIDATGSSSVTASPPGYADEGIDARAEVIVVNTLTNNPPINDTLTFYLKGAGKVITPDAATAFVTILDPLGAVLRARGAAVISTGGRLTLTQQWNESGTPAYALWEDYCALWEWQVSGVPFADRQFFDVVRTKLPCLIDTSDLQELLPTITTHLVAIGEVDCTKFIRRAWSEILDRIRSGANRPSLIMDRSRLVNPAVKLAMAKTCFALTRAPADIWDKRKDTFTKEYEVAWAGLGELKYDIDEDGRVADVEKTRVNRKRFSV